MRPDLRIRRVYDPPDRGDGMRILVDRLWPRGISRELAEVSLWLREIAPSDDLRKRVHRNPAYPDDDRAWNGFVEDYRAELAAMPATIPARILAPAATGIITLLYAVKHERRNNAVVLRDWLLTL